MAEEKGPQELGARISARDRLENIYKWTGCRRDNFLNSIRMGGVDSQFASEFGLERDRTGGYIREQYIESAGKWWDRRHRQATSRIVENVEPMQAQKEVKLLHPEDALADCVKVSPSLGGMTYMTMQVPDPAGRRTARMALLHPAYGLFPEAGELKSIKTAINSRELVDGVTEKMPYELPVVVPWQRVQLKRTMMILPEGFGGFEDCPYYLMGKGLRFGWETGEEFDLIAEKARLTGGRREKGERVDVKYDENGLMRFVRRPLEMYMGMDYDQAVVDYSMMLVAIRRGIKRHVNVDDPLLFGAFEDIVSPAGRTQGFLVTRVHDKGMRGDTLGNFINFGYLSKLALEYPDRKDRLVDGIYDGVDEMVGQIDSGRFKKMTPELVTDEHITQFRQLITNIRKNAGVVASATSVEDVRPLFHYMWMLNSSGVETSGPEVLFEGGVDEKLMAGWRHDLEQTYRLAGMANRVVLEHGLAHEQTYAGNIRFDIQAGGGVKPTVCDWHDSHDLVPMTYPKAFGYATHSFVNLLTNAFGTQSQAVNRFVKPDLVEAAINGHQLQNPGNRLPVEAVDKPLLRSLHDAATHPAEGISVSTQPETRMVIEASQHIPLYQIDHPLIEYMKNVIPERKHVDNRRRFD